MDTSKIDDLIEAEIGLDPNSSSFDGASLYIDIRRLQKLLYKAYIRGKLNNHES